MTTTRERATGERVSSRPLARGGSRLAVAWACRARRRARGAGDLDGGNHTLRRQRIRRAVVLLMALSGSAVACHDNVPSEPPPPPPPRNLTIDSISPASVAAGSSDLTVTLTGSVFSGSRAVWSVKDSVTVLATTFVSSTELVAVVPAALLRDTVVAQVYLLSHDLTEDMGWLHSNAVPFTVTPAPDDTTVAEVVISQPPASIGAGETALLHAWANAASVGRIRPSSPIVWQSENPTIASVVPADEGGIPGVDFWASLHGVKRGTFTIRAATGRKSADLTIAVGEPAKYMTISGDATTLSAAECQSMQIATSMWDASGNHLAGRQAVWTSSDAGVAYVDPQSGWVAARDSGTATITATTGLISAKVTIHVVGHLRNPRACMDAELARLQ